MSALAQRRRALVEQSAAQRQAIVAAAGPLLQKAAAADRILAGLRRHRVAITALGAAVVLLGSRKLFDIATRIVTVYALFRN
jgi:YqjK-like protein